MNNEASKRNDVNWVEVIWYLSDLTYLEEEKIARLSDQFGQVTIATPENRPAAIGEEIHWLSFHSGETRAEIWNASLKSARKKWALFIEDDEVIRLSSLPGPEDLKDHTWTPALIRREKGGSCRQFYQMRFIRVSAGKATDIFDGKNIPDCSRYIRENNIDLWDKPVIIERESSPTAHVNIYEELSVKEQSPQLYLIQGERFFREKKYVMAAAQYRQLLKKEKLLPYDRLAGVNGLASCLAEQHKWDKAMTLARESLKAESLQSLPYLMLFRIHELKKEWREAYKILDRYYRRLNLFSRANFDRHIDEEQTLVYLSDVALKAGNRKEAVGYFKQLFAFKRGGIDRSLLKKALVLSVELDDRERSIQLFERLFGDALYDSPREVHRGELDDLLSMFMKRGWYEYASEIYSKLHDVYPADAAYKRKLIVALTKTNRLDQAQKMVANML